MMQHAQSLVRNLILAVIAVAGLTRCGPGGPERAEISLADHADALTAAAGDNLFTLTLVKSSKAYELASISVTAGLPGQTASVMNFTHQDPNANGKLDPAETLTVKEPIVNLFDPATVSKAVTVSFDERDNGTYFSVGSGTWTPTN